MLEHEKERDAHSIINAFFNLIKKKKDGDDAGASISPQELIEDVKQQEEKQQEQQQSQMLKYRENSFISQLKKYLTGQADKTELGTAWDCLMTACGSDFVKFFTYKGFLERTKAGESFLGALHIWGGVDANGNKIKRGTIIQQNAALEKAKKLKDEREATIRKLEVIEEYNAKKRAEISKQKRKEQEMAL